MRNSTLQRLVALALFATWPNLVLGGGFTSSYSFSTDNPASLKGKAIIDAGNISTIPIRDGILPIGTYLYSLNTSCFYTSESSLSNEAGMLIKSNDGTVNLAAFKVGLMSSIELKLYSAKELDCGTLYSAINKRTQDDAYRLQRELQENLRRFK